LTTKRPQSHRSRPTPPRIDPGRLIDHLTRNRIRPVSARRLPGRRSARGGPDRLECDLRSCFSEPGAGSLKTS
jgi:hypothetical protein